MKPNKFKGRFSKCYASAIEFMLKYKTSLLIAYLVSSVILFFVQFSIFENWDMLTRILGGNFLLHNGFYFEPARALLESLIMGLLAFPFGVYAVYAFIVVGVALFALAIYRFSSAFSIDPLLLLLVFLNPLFIEFFASNGSEMFVIPFLMLAIAEIKNKSYLSGLFFALAFVSKYYALFFLPLLIFVFFGEHILSAIKKLIANIAIFIAALTPFFLYNLFVYGNVLYTFALAYLNFGVEEGPAPYFVFTGLVELSIPVALLLVVFLLHRKGMFSVPRKRFMDIAMLAIATLIGVYVYNDTGYLLLFGTNAYRYFMPAFAFSLLLAALFIDKTDLPWLAVFSTISLVLVAIVLSTSYTAAYQGNAATQSAVAYFQSVYGTTNCTVYSNNWVPLDYYGLPASAPPAYSLTQYNGTPIVSFGTYNTSFQLLFNSGNIYIYGGNYCKFHKIQLSFLSSYNAYLLHTGQSTIPNDPCLWLFGMSPNVPALNGICSYFTTVLS